MGVSSLPKTVTRQRRECDLNPGPSAPESSTLTTRLPTTLRKRAPSYYSDRLAKRVDTARAVTSVKCHVSRMTSPQLPTATAVAGRPALTIQCPLDQTTVRHAPAPPPPAYYDYYFLLSGRRYRRYCRRRRQPGA